LSQRWLHTRRVLASEKDVEQTMNSLARNTIRGILGIVMAAAANWLANYIVDRIFGPEEEYS
jgi:hypothetical protein